jgi:hypothetical protein
MGETETISYMKYEITKVGADSATQKFTMLDKDKKPNEYVPPSETEIKFTTRNRRRGQDLICDRTGRVEGIVPASNAAQRAPSGARFFVSDMRWRLHCGCV